LFCRPEHGKAFSNECRRLERLIVDVEDELVRVRANRPPMEWQQARHRTRVAGLEFEAQKYRDDLAALAARRRNNTEGARRD
jgi:hypothetical protein